MIRGRTNFILWAVVAVSGVPGSGSLIADDDCRSGVIQLMFCPKCGTKNPDAGKFCRSCGSDLSVVSDAISGERRDLAGSVFEGNDRLSRRHRIRTDPDEAWSAGVRQTIFGIGFLIISYVLFATNVAGGNAWWWAMLFPAFSFLSGGISNIVRGRRLEKRQMVGGIAPDTHNQIPGNGPLSALPPVQTGFVRPDSAYSTGDLVPPSVVENTTRHLAIDDEGETMTLPKKPN